MKVAVVFYADFGSPRGKGTIVSCISKELRQRGYLSQVLVRDVYHIEAGLPRDLVKASIPTGNFLPRALVAVERYLWKRFPSRLYGEQLFDCFASWQLTNSDDIVYAVPRMARTFARAKRLGHITVLHAAEIHPARNIAILKEEYDKFPIYNPSWDQRLMLRSLISIELADYIIAQSEFAKGTYLEQGYPANRIFINPSGVDLNKFKPALHKNNKPLVYLFVGNVFLMKGIYYLLEAWRQLNLQEAKLILCGEIGVDAREVLRKYMSTMGNIEIVRFADPMKYYQKASVFVFPSLSEGMSRATLEAMACHLPVICTFNSGSVVTDGVDGFVIPARDIEALKEKMLYFYHQPDEIERMGRYARLRAEEFSCDKWARRTVDIFERICAAEN